jgi:hypothetical protein
MVVDMAAFLVIAKTFNDQNLKKNNTNIKNLKCIHGTETYSE